MLNREKRKLAKALKRRKTWVLNRNKNKGRKLDPFMGKNQNIIDGPEFYKKLKEQEAKNKPSAPKRESALKKLMKVFTRGNK